MPSDGSYEPSDRRLPNVLLRVQKEVHSAMTCSESTLPICLDTRGGS